MVVVQQNVSVRLLDQAVVHVVTAVEPDSYSRVDWNDNWLRVEIREIKIWNQVNPVKQWPNSILSNWCGHHSFENLLVESSSKFLVENLVGLLDLLVWANSHELFHRKMRGVLSLLAKFLSNELFIEVLKTTIIVKSTGLQKKVLELI